MMPRNRQLHLSMSDLFLFLCAFYFAFFCVCHDRIPLLNVWYCNARLEDEQTIILGL